MAIYAVGDIQGCHAELVQLLDQLHSIRRWTGSGWSATW